MTKILVIGLDCAAPELLLGMDDLPHLRHLMQAGCYGELESVVPPITVPAWLCMATSQDPGSLGLYGFRNRADYSYDNLAMVSSRSSAELTIWDQVAREGGRSILLGVPPSYPPRKIHGTCVGCFLTPDTAAAPFTYPEAVGPELRHLAGGAYPVDVKGFRTDDKPWLLEQLYALSRTQFAAARHLMTSQPWDYFQMVEIGLDRVQHGFWKHHDPAHLLHEPDSPYREVVRDYYRHLDAEVGSLLEQLDEETVVLVASDHGARRLDGGFCVNEWLMREGLLALHTIPREVTPPSRLAIDWSRTTAWGEGGYYARIFLNVRGREPEGTIAPEDYDKVRDELKARLEATEGPDGRPLGTLVFRPEETYRAVRQVAPDLIVHFGALAWRSVGGVGYGRVHVQENDTGPDDCNHAQFGSFVLAGPGVPALGELRGAHLLDAAPTLLELAGRDVPPSMQGRSILSMSAPSRPEEPPYSAHGEATVRDRLSGLGYLG